MQQRADLGAVVRLVIEEMLECVRKINPECQDNGSKERTMDSVWDGFLALSATFAQAPPIDCFGCQRVARVFFIERLTPDIRKSMMIARSLLSTLTTRLQESAVVAIEIKRSSAPTLKKGFAIACDDLQIEQRYLIYPGQETFPIRHGVQAIGLAELMRRLQAQ